MECLSKQEKTRIVWVDYLRVIGLILVILPHVFGTNNIFCEMLFACNVPIMVFVSGYVSYRSAQGAVLPYYWKRIKTLVFPTWIFFLIYFSVVAIHSISTGFPYTWRSVLKTFLFMDGIGFTWVITVFLMIALVIPIIGWVLRHIPASAVLIPILYVLVGVAVLLLQFNHFIVKAFLYVAGYILIAFLGYAIQHNKKHFWAFFAVMAVTYAVAVLVTLKNGNSPWLMSQNKYPPNVLYVAYGATISLLLMSIFGKLEKGLQSFFLTKPIVYISKNSFQLYLWHIMGLYLASDISNRILQLLVVLIVSFGGTALYQFVQRCATRIIKKA